MGAILLTLVFFPLIACATIARICNFIDLLYRGKITSAIISISASPFFGLMTIVIGMSIFLESGWKTGLFSLIRTFPARNRHFFKKELFFGSQENEFIKDVFGVIDLDDFVTPDFFGKLTLKLLSLCFPMEFYLSADAKLVSPHNDVSLYFTEKNIKILIQKYASMEQEQSALIYREINSYLAEKLREAHDHLDKARVLFSIDNTQLGKLQSAQDECNALQAAERCLEYFISNKRSPLELSNRIKCSSATVLNYIWLAINTECPDKHNNHALKEKLIWTLFQIQRGFNIVQDGNGVDMPECPSGAIGLLVRFFVMNRKKYPVLNMRRPIRPLRI